MDSGKPPDRTDGKGDTVRVDLPPEIKASELAGMRVIVLRNEKTGDIAPARVIRGADFQDYEAFMAAINLTLRELQEEIRGGDWTVEDAWARSIDEFMNNYPELVPTIWR